MASKNKTDASFVTSNGITIQIKRVEPGFMQRVMRSVPLPKRPTYRTRTISGKEEEFPLDAISAAERPEDLSRWVAYREEMENAMMERNEKVARALYIFGTEPFDIPENGWRRKYEMIGVDIPADPDELRAFYISCEFPVDDQTALVQAISRMAGVTEDMVKEAEETFRN